ncbi:hypothetical protein [Paraburkholderia sp. HD33-4]|uniref:hypothetical protein n=1 Tax=Paraburkholderia sp. HD33-4 TaxID=2883242 RepID=UPI001F39187E|nr:hypothetical protein [Paraburkholderia sp. HD33-4]
MTELERLEAELAARTTPVRPAAARAEQERLERDERNLRAKLHRDLERQKMLDAMTIRHAEERRAREAFFDESPYWRDT